MLETLYIHHPKEEKLMSKKSISRKDRICWLAGIIDGEGCIAVYLDESAKHGKTLDMRVKITNTCMKMIRQISEILTENHIGFYYATNGNTNPALEISASGQGRVEALLNLVRPYLVTKAEQADTVLELIRYRKSLGYKVPENGGTLLKDSKIIELVQRIKDLKHQRVSPLACHRQANKILGIPIDYTSNMVSHEDIVRPSQRCAG
jgi:hypothetical protein